MSPGIDKFYTYFVLSLILVISFSRFFSYISSEAYLVDSNDRFYYLAVAESLYDDGNAKNIVTEPPSPILNFQFGIIYMFYIFRIMFFNFSDVMLASSAIGYLLFLSSLYPFIKICSSLNINLKYSLTGFLGLCVFPEYLELIVMGITESYFYPLLLWWLYYFKKVLDNSANHYQQLLVLMVFSLLLLLFRLQALIIFSSALAYLFLNKEFRTMAQVFGIIILTSIIVYSDVFSIIYEIAAETSETSVFTHIVDSDGSNFSKMFTTINMLFFNYRADSAIRPLSMWLISYPLILITLFYGIIENKKNIASLTFLFSIIICLSIFALTVMYGYRINLRYIYYILPLLIINLLYHYSITKFTYLKYYIIACSVLVILLNFRIQLFYIFNSYQGHQERMEVVESFKEIERLTYLYQPEQVYNRGPIRSPRFVFATTRQSVITDFSQGFLPNSFVFIAPDLLTHYDLSGYKYLLNYNFGEEYLLYFVPPEKNEILLDE